MYASATRWSLTSPDTFVASPSTTRSSASLLAAMTQCGSREVFGFAGGSASDEVQRAANPDAQQRYEVRQPVSTHRRQPVCIRVRQALARFQPRGRITGKVELPGRRLLLSHHSTPTARSPGRYSVEAEEVGGVVAALDLDEPIPGRPRVGRAHPPLALVAQEVDVHAAIALLQRRCEIAYPRFARSPLLRTLIERGDIHHDARGAVGERGGLGAHASHRPTQDPDLCYTHRCVGGPKVLEDRL